VKLRLLLALLIGHLPSNPVRVGLYRMLCGYRITSGARIGYGTVIAVDKAEIGHVIIGRFNRFHGPITLTIGDETRIGSRNVIVAGALDYDRTCTIGPHALITSGHYLDVVGGFAMGEHAWIAGYGSQFWTHGLGTTDRRVEIGNNCYLGSAVRFAPGTSVADNTVVAMGSVVTNKVTDPDVLIAGVPARVVGDNSGWLEQLPRNAAARRAGETT